MIPDNLVKIGDIRKRKMYHLNVIGKVEMMKNEPRAYKKHATAIISDETGKIRLVLWRDQVDQVKVGDTIMLLDAFTRHNRGRFSIETWQEVISKVSPSDLQKLNEGKIKIKPKKKSETKK